jgi:hypothetical protein
MIELFLTPGDSEAAWIEAGFKEMVLGYRRVELLPEQVEAVLGKPLSLPVVRHDERLICGREDLLAYLQELERLAEDWRRFQTDACYIDDDGEVC